MKKTILSFIILILSFISTAQCVKLYVKDEIVKFQLCNLSEGDYIEICINEKEVHACQYNFKYYSKGTSNGSLIYELVSQNGVSSQITLMVNPNTQRFSFSIGGLMGIYAYNTEAEMETIWAREAEQKRQEQERQAKLKLDDSNQLYYDYKTISDINSSLSTNNFTDAAVIYEKLKLENNRIQLKATIQEKLDLKYYSEIIELTSFETEEYIKLNMLQLQNTKPGTYSIYFNKNGIDSITNFPKLSKFNEKSFGNNFKVNINSHMTINIELKDSILISTAYSSNCDKPLYIDNSENFYRKTKTNLPVAKISFDANLEKNQVLIKKKYVNYKFANGIPIVSNFFIIEELVMINKKE